MSSPQSRAPPLPPWEWTGFRIVNDPRSKLKPGLYDAGEIGMGLKHVTFLKKPDAFQLNASSPDDPVAQKTLRMLGVGDPSKHAKAPADGDCDNPRSPTPISRSRAIICSRAISTA